MKKYKHLLIWLNLAILLWLFNRSVFEKENVLNTGKLVLLEIFPVDSTADAQRDFIKLQYQQLDAMPADRLPQKGFCMVRTDERGRVDSLHIQDAMQPRQEHELAIKYLVKNGSVAIGAGTYYFQKGNAANFNRAKYAGLKVNEAGDAVLFALYDGQLVQLQ